MYCAFSIKYSKAHHNSKLVYLKGRNAAVGKEKWRNGKLSVKFLVEGDGG